ncbi:MAG: hypothetical protein H6742_08895 [Alphaproteobacteria bacterium]|nr:hypothetical protein [Alphaproteobacteria bacterium]
MSTTDALPRLVAAFVADPRGPDAPALLQQVLRQVQRVSKSYPDAYFALGRKSDDAVLDLGHRVFSICASVPKGRFPFQTRVPFVAFVEEQFDGRAIRYHSFYAKLSITRELLRDDYARNLARDPVLRWRADLYRDIGKVLREHCDSERPGRAAPLRWRLRDPGLSVVVSWDRAVARLKADAPHGDREHPDLEPLVLQGLRLVGPSSRARLTELCEAVLGAPPDVEHALPITPAGDPRTTMAVRQAVLDAWNDLDADSQDLLVAVAHGTPYDELIAAHPRFRHKVAVTRAVKKIGQGFVDRVVGRVAGEDAGREAAGRPMDLIETVLEVLIELLPELRPVPPSAPPEAP